MAEALEEGARMKAAGFYANLGVEKTATAKEVIVAED